MSAPTNLVTIRPGVTFQADAAASFQRVEARAGRRVDVNSTYRDWNTQMRLYLAYKLDPKSNPLALHPDQSMHCRGLALDTDDHALMRSMGDYGWRATVPSEPWHFDYFRTLDKHYGQPAGETSKPFPPPDFAANRRRKEDTMYVRGTTNKSIVYNVFTDANGAMRLRLCGKNETAYAFAGGLVITGDDPTLTGLGVEGQYKEDVIPEVTLVEDS